MILFSGKTLKVKEEKDLKIVNIMSSAALRGNKQEAVYCATKWGERGYTESLKNELIVSTISVLASLFAIYLQIRRSKFSFSFYMINDVILMVLGEFL